MIPIILKIGPNVYFLQQKQETFRGGPLSDILLLWGVKKLTLRKNC